MDIKETIKELVTETLKDLGAGETDFVVEHPADIKMGDYSTNVAMTLAKSSKTNPKEMAQRIAETINKNLPKEISKAEAVNGFVNFHLSQKFFAAGVGKILEGNNFGSNQSRKGQKTIVEHTDPNPFKEFHIGHLRPNIVGSAVAQILEWNGAEVKQACYQGDVGLHVAKAVWGFLFSRDWSKAYAIGWKAYEEDAGARAEINEINKKIYAKNPELWKVYQGGREESLENFEKIYKRLGTRFDFYFFESDVAPYGKEIVEENVGKVFERGEEGAIIFKGEKYDKSLHTRVFVNKEGLPTYEAKELGLAKVKYDKYPYDRSVIITGNEINDYFKVLLASMREVFPELAEKTLHFSHGMLRLPTGKMSSRTGEVITADSLIEEVKNRVKGDESVAIGAIKYMILRQAIGGDIIFDIEKSVSTEGDSGVYLQYSFARANSIVEKARTENVSRSAELPSGWQTFELERLLYRFPEVVLRAGEEFAPHHIINYLTELARAFNSFYGNEQIVDAKDASSPYKIALAESFATVMKNGLSILGIEAPERM
jgi:arginyl-tRNA synthetase